MRIILAFILFISFNLKAQSPTVALTAGSEFCPLRFVEGQSITESHIEYRSDVNFNSYTKESKLTPQSTSYPVKTSGGLSKDKIILFTGLLIAVALFYMTKRSNVKKTEEQTLELANVNFEEEEKSELKKEVWNLMATQPVLETETISENIIATKPESYTKHTYACSEGQLIIEQAYQNPNVGEKVILNASPAPNGKYKIGLLLSVEVVEGKISKVLS